MRKVIVHTPGEERLGLAAPPEPAVLIAARSRLAALQEEHAQFKGLLQRALGRGAVLELRQLLEEVFDDDEQRRRTILMEILGGSTDGFVAGIEATGRLLGDVESKVIVDALVLGSSPSLLWVRDPATCTPLGLIIHEMAQPHRAREPALLRAALRHHPMFAADSIFLDLADRTGMHSSSNSRVGWNLLDGGNTLVLGDDALAVGVPRPPPFDELALEPWLRRVLLAGTPPRIERIYLVYVPPAFGHLDAVLTPFAPGCAVAMPYLLGGPGHISRQDIRRGVNEYRSWSRATGRADPRPHRLTAGDFDGGGLVEVFVRDPRRPGEISRLSPGRGILDQLVDGGVIAPDRIAWIGGCRDDHSSPASHLAAALREQAQQAGNLLSLVPGEVMMNGDNPGTRTSLERIMASAERSFRIRELSMAALAACYGGPRCLTLPLLRSE